jgi:UDP:flavonoid glycosyltransferase YjiC (YdhE family)
MRALLTTHRGAGHFGPMIPFAHALTRAGHDVLVAAPRPAGPMVARAGLDFHPVEEADPAAEAPIYEQLRSLGPEAANELIMRELFGRIRGAAALPATLEAVAGWGPDLVLHEISELAGPAAAARYGVAHARVGIGLAIGEEWGVGPINDALADLRARLGAAGERIEHTPYLTLAPPSLEFPSPHPPRALRFRDPAGGVRPLPDWWGGSDDPLVYVSFGSAAPNFDFFGALCRAVLDAVADLPLRILFTIGDQSDPEALGSLPRSVHVERWVPQADVMPHAAAMVGHGGSGSTLMAMAAGVPLAVVPLFADQPYNARRVAQIGAGIALEGGVEAVSELPRAIRTLLEEPRYLVQARRVAAEVAALPPVDDAVRVLEDYAEGRALAA